MSERRRRWFDRTALALVTTAGLGAALPCALHEESLAVLGKAGAPPSAAADTMLAHLYRALAEALATFDAGWLGRPAGAVGIHHAALWLAAAGVGLGAVAVHGAATASGLSRGRAMLAALFAALCPAATVAATTIHVHGFVLLLGAGAAWLAAAAVRRDSLRLAAGLGLLCGVSVWLAPAGLLLPIAVLPFFLGGDADAPATHARRLAHPALMIGLGLALAAVLRRGDLLRLVPSLEQVASFDLGTLGPLWLRDAGRACLPLSLVAVLAVWSQRHHRAALLLVLASLLATALGAHWTATLGDEGSFLLPLLPFSAILAARWLSRRLALLLLLAAAGLSATKLCLRADWHACTEWTAGLHEVAGERPFLVLLGPQRDPAFALATLPADATLSLWPTVDDPANVPACIASLQQQAAKVALFVTDEAEQALRDPVFRARHPAASLLLQSLATTFVLRPVSGRGFQAMELRTR